MVCDLTKHINACLAAPATHVGFEDGLLSIHRAFVL